MINNKNCTNKNTNNNTNSGQLSKCQYSVWKAFGRFWNVFGKLC